MEMPPYRAGLSPKLKAWCDVIIEGSVEDGTEAARKVYNLTNPNSAKSISWENAQKPSVKAYFRAHRNVLSENMMNLALESPSESVKYQATKTGMEWSGEVEPEARKGGDTFIIGVFQKIYNQENNVLESPKEAIEGEING
jgi:hypothetical protein